MYEWDEWTPPPPPFPLHMCCSNCNDLPADTTDLAKHCKNTGQIRSSDSPVEPPHVESGALCAATSTPDLVSMIWCNIIKFDTVIFLRRFHSSEKSNKGEYRFFLIHLQHNQLQLGGKEVGYHLHRRESQQVIWLCTYILSYQYLPDSLLFVLDSHSPSKSVGNCSGCQRHPLRAQQTDPWKESDQSLLFGHHV